MRVLLIMPKGNYPQPEPFMDLMPLGMPYLSGALKAAGHEVYGLDINYEFCEEGATKSLARTFVRMAYKYQPHIIGVGGQSANYSFVRDAMIIARKLTPHIPIVSGGGLISADPDFILRNLRPDFAVFNEGEETMVDLVDCLEKGGDLDSVAGIAYWKNGDLVRTEARKPISDLDNIPLPDYSPFGIERYFSLSNQLDNYYPARTQRYPKIMPVIRARSCPYKCTFCYHSTGETYRSRSIENVMEEITYFHSKYRFNILVLYDELFSTNQDAIREFCQRLREMNLKLDWSCALRVGDVSMELMREMKDAGCMHVSLGFESAHPKVLESMRKKITVDQIRRSIEIGEEAGVGIQANFIFGDVAETENTVKATYKFFNDYCRDHAVHNGTISPFPGSPIFNYCIENGIIKDKQKYYESINNQPPINMTRMPNKTFRDLIYPILRDKFVGFKSSEVLSSEVCGSLVYPTYSDDYVGSCGMSCKETKKGDVSRCKEYLKVMINVRCPHCNQEVSYLFPLRPDFSTQEGKLSAIEPIVQFCSLCHKRFIIPTVDIVGVGDVYRPFIEKLDDLGRRGDPIVMLPLVTQLAIDIHKFYGMDIDNYDVDCFIDGNDWPEEGKFLSYPVHKPGSTQFDLIRDYDFVVLPCTPFQHLVQSLTSHGIPMDKITYCEY